ncbi:hypothetical protein KUG85_04910 [Nitratireductor sp. L1-7-SE]|uniref:Uncharacterized protein n=1 Tax=Nitratireductor rhodophyticola TaxID=2854036 RepID=A0ABS7RFP5_9HYPH|nr:hypothetical protein [Nitratireductor rhodophyticola]MBY8918786.1 hypothetical protein [Nitratireductor rhodophyticola]MBY8920030.1 hypothetical protein [Nitratireductor rhodophyticola]
MSYASTTNVSVSKTKGEIDGLLRKHKAAGFGVFEEQTRAMLVFEMSERRIVFHLPLPDQLDKEFVLTARGKARSADAALAAWEQACRSRWRALFLCIKAKLESIESDIESFEDAFLAQIQMPDGHSVSEHVKPRIAQAYETGTMQPLLPAPKGGA